MIFFHYCESYLNNTSIETKESVSKSLQSYVSRDTLKGVGKVSNFTGGIYILLIKSPHHLEIIIEERVLQHKGQSLKVYFVRGLKNGLSDYVSIRDGKWLKSNKLDEREILLFLNSLNEPRKREDKNKNYPPDELVNWQNEFKLKVRYNIFESESWVKYSMSTVSENGMSISLSELYKLLLIDVCDDSIIIKQSKGELIENTPNYSILKSELNDVSIIYLSIVFDDKIYYLLHDGARVSTQKEHWENATQIEKIKSLYKIENYHDLCRIALRAYPSWALKIPDLWLKIEKNSEFGNLSLLPEQTEFLDNFKFPQYINGQAGSGKSTMLYYLFANTYYYKYADLIKGDIIFLTENEKLLEHTKKSVRELLSYNSEFIDLTSEEIAITNLESHFYSFKNFLLKLIPNSLEPFSNQEKFINFPKFKQLYSESNISTNIKQKFSAEYVWFILSTYIYGNDINGIINSSNYETKMPKDGKELISLDDFKRVENEIIKPYYEKWLNEQGYWDKITLIKFIYKNIQNIKQYDVIFCDEAQDFSKVELAFILQLSNYSNYNLSNVPQFPIVFAGDALQTVNPTGFKTEVLTSMIFQELTNEKIGFRLEQTKLIYEPKYNYRSSQTIVNLANVIQYERKTNLDARINQKQISKRPNFYENQNVNIFIEEATLLNNNDLLDKLKSKTIIVPVNTNEIPAYKLNNPMLNNNDFSILSAVDAKGIDFNEVVIFKFGEYYKTICNNNYEKQFFFNKLYVAITRAQQELIIIDDSESKNEFWISMIENFFESDWNKGEYSITKISDILIYDVNSVKQSTAKDIQKDATSLKEQGTLENNTSLLVLASSNFFKLGDIKEYYLCLGEIAEIENKWLKAAEFYLKKEVKNDGIEKAANVYFKGGEWNKLLEISNIIKNEINKIRGLIAKVFIEQKIETDEIKYLFDERIVVKSLISQTNWRNTFFEKLKFFYNSSANKNDRSLILDLINAICKSDDSIEKIFLINEYFKLQQHDTVISLFDDIGINYEIENLELLKIFYRSNLEIAKRKNDIENIIIWLGSLAIKTDESKQLIASEILSFYKSHQNIIINCANVYVKLYIYFSYLLLDNNEKDVLQFAKNVEHSFHEKNNENGLSEEYYDLFKRNDFNTSIQIFIIERYVKNAFDSGQPIEIINEKYKALIQEKNLPYIPFTDEEINSISKLPDKLNYVSSDHFSSLKINGFRRFENLEIENIGLFNLIVGDNNVGKTSFLEALLFSSNTDIYLERLAFAYIQRANILPDKDLSSDQFKIFYKLNSSFFKDFLTNKNNNTKISFEFSYKRNTWNYEIDSNSFNYKLIEELPFTKSLQMPLMPYGKGFSLDLAQVYYDVIVNSSDANTEDSFLENINLFIPGAKRIIANPKDGSIKIRLEDTPNELIPIHQFGDGANKLFRILILLTLHKGRRLMLDEIDSGIHYTKFKEFWKAILVLALKENTQIFATTHNEECIRYFNEVLTDLGDEYQIRSKIIQLEKINNHIRAYTLDFESLKLSVDEDLEIRGGEI